MIEDTADYKEMMRMNHGNFCEILGMIEPNITPKDILGATEVINCSRKACVDYQICGNRGDLPLPSCKMFDMFKLPMDTLGTARAWAQHVELCKCTRLC